MKTYIKPSIEVVETEVEQMLLSSLSTTGTGASSKYDCLDKGEKNWTDASSFWGE